MRQLTIAPSAFVLAALMLARLAVARAQPAPLPDKPFAEHRIVLQLSDNDPKKQGLVISVAYNLLKTLRSRQGRDRGGGVRAGHRSVASGQSQPQADRKPGRAGRASSTSASIPSTRSSARPASGRKSFRSRRRFRSGSDKSCRSPKTDIHWFGHKEICHALLIFRLAIAALLSMTLASAALPPTANRIASRSRSTRTIRR